MTTDRSILEPKHTAGDWSIDGQFDAEIAIGIVAGNPDECNSICEIGPSLEEWTEEEIANARLIAAGPDLLRALRCCWERAFIRKFPGDEEAFKLTNAALAKALGITVIDVGRCI